MSMATRQPLELLHSNNNNPTTPFRKRRVVDVILQSRSLDDDYDNMTRINEEGEQSRNQLGSAVTSLHSSFDATILSRDEDVESIFRKPRVVSSPSWDESMSGRKHSLPPSNGSDGASYQQPGTVRKVARRSSNPPRGDRSKTPGKTITVPPTSGLKKAASTPSSGRRRRNTQHPRKSKSPFRKIPPVTPRTWGMDHSTTKTLFRNTPSHTTPLPLPTATEGKSKIQTCNTATTANTSFDATNDTHDSASPVSTPFRFSSFPASLPRVNPRAAEHEFVSPVDAQLSNKVRKRMLFTQALGSQTEENADEDGSNNDIRSPLHAVGGDEDEARNSSFSSVSAGDPQAIPQATLSFPPPVLSWQSPDLAKNHPDSVKAAIQELPREPSKKHSELFSNRLFSTGEAADFSYSDDESPVRINVARTRLDFNVVMDSSRRTADKQEDPTNNGQRRSSTPPPRDLNEPYEQRRTSSFPSTVSSSTTLHNLSCYDDMTTGSTSNVTPSRSGVNASLGHSTMQPASPDEVKFRSRLDAAQFSPIPTDDGDPNTDLEYRMEIDGSPQHRNRRRKNPKSNDRTSSPRLSVSQSSESSSGSSKLRRLRPMPDMSAFDAGMSVRSGASSRLEKSDDSLPSSPKLLCPPTPVRTPAWAHNDGHQNLFLRTNSLIVTKVLATCPSDLVDGLPQLHGGSRDREEGSFAPQSVRPPLPPPVSSRREEDTVREADFGNETSGHGASASHVLQTPLHPSRTAAPTPGATPVISFTANFENLGTLGSGAFADVYKVRSREDSQLYAVKRNRRQFRGKRDREIALAEVRMMQKLQCESGKSSGDAGPENPAEYILSFYRAWQEDGYFYCQTELCCRDTCSEMLDSLRSNWQEATMNYSSLQRLPTIERGTASHGVVIGCLVPETTIWKIAHDVGAGLKHIHAHNIVHSDIKPSNIFFVSHKHLGAICKIGDFGIASEVGAVDDGQEGDTVYMAPDLLSSGGKETSVDIFSLGLTLYDLAADVDWEMPMEGPRWHELRSASHIPELPQSRSVQLRQLVQRMIRPRPAERPTADSVLRVLQVAEAGTRPDDFLRDYITDIEKFDKLEESRKALLRQEADDIGQTPRNAETTGRELRTPTPFGVIPPPPMLFTPTPTSKGK